MCESCGKNAALDRPVAFPEAPMVYHLCQTCVNAGAIPYDLLLTWVWLGHIDRDSSFARNVALYHGNSQSQFEADAANFAEKMDEMLEP